LSAEPPIREDVEEAAIAAGVAALSPTDAATEASVQEEMASLHHQDRIWAAVWVGALVVVLPFLLIALWSTMPSTGVKLVLLGAAAVLLTYNLASMLALVRNYTRDRDFIYRRDVAHLREQRAARAALRGQR
jgi:hypothetical protein